MAPCPLGGYATTITTRLDRRRLERVDRRVPALLCRLTFSLALAVGVVAGNWPQFRGPEGRSIAEGPEPPAEFGPSHNVAWQIELPPGNSSPVIWGDRIFLTAVESNQLVTLVLNRSSGERLVTRRIPVANVESTHRLGSPATPTPCTDGERVYSYFGSFGVLAMDLEGREVWRHELPPPVVEFGTSASPILADQLLIMVCDQDDGSFLLALDKRTGKTVWRRERPEFRRSFATPFVWRHDGIAELIVPGSVWLVSYSLDTGVERWRYAGTSRVATSSPTSGDGLLFSASWNLGGDALSRVSMPRWAEFAPDGDTNHDGMLAQDEAPAGPIGERFSQMDFNKDRRVSPAEWDAMADLFARAQNAVLAIRPGGQGTLAPDQLAWKSTRSLPYVSSPLFHRGRLFTVKNGGLASAYEARTGRVLFQDERLGVTGDFYASAVACGERIFIANQDGTVVVLRAADTLDVLARNRMGESIMATPAIADGVLYLRTADHLFAFRAAATTP